MPIKSALNTRFLVPLCCGGWLLAIFLGILVLPRLYNRLILKFPSVQRDRWNGVLEQKKSEFSAVHWADSRPLYIVAGDSHVEMGCWYDLFDGAYAIRNCGLSRATIADVNALVGALTTSNPKAVVLMCGVNDVLRGHPPEKCLADYEQLLQTTRSSLHPERIVVVSVMPVRQTLADKNSRDINGRILMLNSMLQDMCQRNGVIFAHVNDSIKDSSGGLAFECTSDGLHLNQNGYRKIVGALGVSMATKVE